MQKKGNNYHKVDEQLKPLPETLVVEQAMKVEEPVIVQTGQDAKLIYLVSSRKSDSVETVFHGYSDNKEAVRIKMEELALEALKDELKIDRHVALKSPLNDTIEVKAISEGITIRQALF